MSTPRDVILTTLQQVDFEYVETFLLSLRRTGFKGRLVIFASAMKSGAVAKLENHGVEVVPYSYLSKRWREFLFWPAWPAWRRFCEADIFPGLTERLAHGALPLFYRRHLLYLQFLRQHQNEFDRVFLTDARDVFFQEDPFVWEPSSGLHFFLIDEIHTVKSFGLSPNWENNQFGRTDVRPHLDKFVSCAGTTFGDTESVITYLSSLVNTSLRARRLRKVTGADDQGVHNYLICENLLPPFTLHSNRRGPVLTTATPTSIADIRFDNLGNVINDLGQVVPVLHQYDRIPELAEHLRLRLKT